MIVQFHVEAGPPRRLICLCGETVSFPDSSSSVTCRCGAVFDVTGRRVTPPARFRPAGEQLELPLIAIAIALPPGSTTLEIATALTIDNISPS